MTEIARPQSNGTQSPTRLDDLLDELAGRMQTGEPVDVEAFLQAHSEHAADLRRMLPAMQVLAGLEASRGDGTEPEGEASLGELGDFRLIREIGRGGMGVVYEAEQLSLRRRVALKLLPFAAALDGKQLQRFKIEAQAAAFLHHTSIVPVYFVGCERGVHYYAMQFIDGRTLAEVVRELRQQAGLEAAQHRDASVTVSPSQAAGLRLPSPSKERRETVAALTTERSHTAPVFFRTVAQWGIQAAEALDHAHEQGVIHRDVKPANLLIDAKGHLWITDFGLAHCQTDINLTLTGDLVGTLRYMSPEQALAKRVPVDHRTDVYSLGATLYELLTLHPAFDGNDRSEILRQISFEDPKSPRHWNGSIPRELETIVLKALEKHPGERYADAQELADDLRRWLEDKPIRAKRPGLRERLVKWARRHPALAAVYGLTVLVLTLAALGGAAVWQWQVAEVALQGKQKAQAGEAEARALSDRFQRAVYFAAHMNMAKNAWDEGRPERVWDVLKQHLPKPGEADLRGFEWHYLRRLYHSAGLLTLPGHNDRVRSVAFSPDGKRLACGSHDGAVKIWDVQTGQDLRTFKLHATGVFGLTFSPDGNRLASTGGEVKVWDAQTGHVSFAVEVGYGFGRSRFTSMPHNPVVFSPDGKLVASADGVGVKVWDVQTGDEVLDLRQPGAGVMAFSPDGKCLASAGGSPIDQGRGFPGRREMTMWDLQARLKLYSPQEWGGRFLGLAFSPDGQRLAGACEDSTVKVLDVQTGKELKTLEGHFADVHSVVFSPDGRRLASTSRDGTLRVWETQTGRELLTFKGKTGADSVASEALSPDGKLWASASDRAVKIRKVNAWDAQTEQDALTFTMHPRYVFSVAFSPDGQRVASGHDDGTIKIGNALTGQPLLELLGHKGHVHSVSFSPDGQRLASACDDQTVRVWDAQTRDHLLTFEKHARYVRSVAYSPDGRHLASASEDGAVKVWDAQTGEVTLDRTLAEPTDGPRPRMTVRVTFSPDGKRLAGVSGNGTMKVWDAQTGQELLLIKVWETSPSGFIGIAFSPDGQRLAIAGWDHPEVKVLDAQTGQELLTLQGHTDGVRSIAFSPDGKRLASGSGDCTVKVWDTQWGQETLTLKGNAERVNSVTFSPDGHRLACGKTDGTVKIWDATPLPP